MSNRSFEYANLANLSFIEKLYAEYLEDPSSIDSSWQRFFEGMAFASALTSAPLTTDRGDVVTKSDLSIFRLIETYRLLGHRFAKINPVAIESLNEQKKKLFSLENFSLSREDLNHLVPSYGFLQEKEGKLSVLIEALEKIYCQNIGFDYVGLVEPEVRQWLQDQIEPSFSTSLSREEKKKLFDDLTYAEMFESFLQLKYPGQKRFSLEGTETLIPILQTVIEEGSLHQIEEVVLGMAHRGRLNVLANVFKKPYEEMFYEFEPSYRPKDEGAGDVKYHKGYEAKRKGAGGKNVDFILCANPSHLESIDPVVAGRVRAHQERNGEKGARQGVLPVLIHGDAAIAGQGVVYETLQLFRLPGYQVGGTLHIIVNNQVGFTATAKESKSTFYCTDIAQSFGAPVFHVNAEDPEGCVAATKLALQVRQKFGRDVFIELNGYRKYGHNESDEPSFTQPILYQTVREKLPPNKLYKKQLVEEGVFSEGELDAVEEECKETLEAALALAKKEEAKQKEIKTSSKDLRTTLEKTNKEEIIETAVPLEELKELANSFCNAPSSFCLHPKVKRILDNRQKAMASDKDALAVDWGLAETLAYATLLTRDKIHIRIAGQDSGRGTFSHRHAILIDQDTDKRYYPLSHLQKEQSSFDVYNSPLSEYAALGFEYGYSLSYPRSLVLWEAQYGDFANGAQIIIDQYLASGEHKWNSSSALTLLLPHGYEGGGPEHSSARLERYLQLASNDNMTLVVPTIATQMFHLLRFQALREQKKPLVVFTPKALLRFGPSLGSLCFLSEGKFQEVIDDTLPPKQIKKVFLSAGKVYYDLLAEREKRNIQDVALVRIEKIYPFPSKILQTLLEKYDHVDTFFWVQEEHENAGGWEYVNLELQKVLPEKKDLRYVGRVRSASPAAGSGALHKEELAALLNEAFS